MNSKLLMVRVDALIPNPEQPRKEFDQAEMESLAESIRENGVILPVAVEETGDPKVFILHDGERRWKASQMAGLKEIPANVMPALNGTGKRERLVRALVANIQRSDLNPIEEGRGYQVLREQGLSVRDISKKVGIYEARIAGRLTLTALDEEVQELISKGKFTKSPDIASKLMEIPDKNVRVSLARGLAERNSSLETCRKAIERVKAKLAQPVEIDPEMARMVQKAQWENRGIVGKARWNMLAQEGAIPPWDLVTQAAKDVCNNCVLASAASEAICGQCPGFFLIDTLMKMAK